MGRNRSARSASPLTSASTRSMEVESVQPYAVPRKTSSAQRAPLDPVSRVMSITPPRIVSRTAAARQAGSVGELGEAAVLLRGDVDGGGVEGALAGPEVRAQAHARHDGG